MVPQAPQDDRPCLEPMVPEERRHLDSPRGGLAERCPRLRVSVGNLGGDGDSGDHPRGGRPSSKLVVRLGMRASTRARSNF